MATLVSCWKTGQNQSKNRIYPSRQQNQKQSQDPQMGSRRKPMELTLPSILIRVSALYLIALAFIRIVGKPSIGELSMMDFVVITILGDGLDSVIYGEVPILQGVVSFATIVLAHLLVSYLSSKSMFVFRLANSPPRILIRKGVVLGEALQAERMRMEMVESEMRLNREDQREEVKEATLEPNGKLSVIKNRGAKPVQKKDLKLFRQG
jgi:uncharacterized membrane protein YcaP (DUF421 family)